MKMEEKSNLISAYYGNYFKKGKNATDTKKKICAVEKVRLSGHVKSGFQFSAGDFSGAGQADQLKWIAIKVRHY